MDGLYVLTLVTILIITIISNRKLTNSNNTLSEQSRRNKEEIESLRQYCTSLARQTDAADKKAHELMGETNTLTKKLDELRKELEFYAGIKSESEKLNIIEDNNQRQELLNQAKSEIAEILTGTSKPSDATEESDTAATEQPSPRVLDSEQSKAIELMLTSKKNMFITGKAGTGKSFLLDIFRGETKDKCIVLAPTGIAAINVHGETIHRAFGYYNLVNLNVEDIDSSSLRLKSEKRLVLREAEIIIIDEISMVRADTLDRIDRILKVINNNNLPFGGKQMLFFGDLFQLPPVARKEEYDYLHDKYGGVHFFFADAYLAGNFSFLELTVNHRQEKDDEFFGILNRVRDGSFTSEDIAALNNKVCTDNDKYKRVTTLLPKKADAETINRNRMEELPKPEYEYKAKVVLDERKNMNQSLGNTFPIEETLRLRKGALVMMTANDPNGRWVNGTLGIVEEINSQEVSVAIGGNTHQVNKTNFTEQEIIYENKKISYKDVFIVSQYPIIPAYAITIHKSQGQTYPKIICDITNSFEAGQAYVALSRCASLDGLRLKKPITESSIRVDRAVVDFYKSQVSII